MTCSNCEVYKVWPQSYEIPEEIKCKMIVETDKMNFFYACLLDKWSFYLTGKRILTASKKLLTKQY